MNLWNDPIEAVLARLNTSSEGLSSKEAKRRLKKFGPNRLRDQKRVNIFYLLWGQFKSPLVLLLLFAAGLSFALYDKTDGIIILSIVFLSALLGFYQEKGALDAISRLLKIVEVRATVVRDGTKQELSIEKIVPGDIVFLSAGDMIPGDCRLLETKDFFVDEATLTGETFAAEKKEGIASLDTPLSKRSNMIFMGSHAVSGFAKAVVGLTAKATEFGKVSEHLKLHPPETAFQHGVRRFGFLLMEATFVLTLSIFAFNLWLSRPFLESFLFALALAVGLTPQLLPAIITVNLSKGAKKMAREKVIVKRLASIENFGSMDVLCADKTGTLTKGEIQLHASLNGSGKKSEKPLFLAYLNAHFETGYVNPIDSAITSSCSFDSNGWKKLDEIPYDFVRKRISILAEGKEGSLLIVKGAFRQVFDICSDVDLKESRSNVEQLFEDLGKEGFRVLAVAYKNIDKQSITADDENNLTFAGMLVFSDPLKEGIAETVLRLRKQGIALKIITGDNHLVARHTAKALGIQEDRVLNGKELAKMSEASLIRRVREVDVFAEVEPNQKERIILSLRKGGSVVGFLGDGINDATALHAADVGISVETGADAAKEVADIVLLHKDLSVLSQGVLEGRKTFANTMKYVFMATSANFGNMFSMAGASLLLNFLPLLPKQILLTNLLTDFPEMAIATDRVDSDWLEKPLKWDIKFIKRFMLSFGLISSIFDYATFGALVWIVKASPEQFRTGWFLESVVSASLIVLVVRTRRPFFTSFPSRPLAFGVFCVVALTLLLPYTPLARPLELAPLPPLFYLLIGGIVACYVAVVEIAKKRFYRK